MERQVIEDYTQNFLTLKQIQKKYKIGQDKIYRILQDNGVKRFTASEINYLRNAKTFGCPLEQKQLEQAVINDYLSGKGQQSTGRPYGLTYSNVKYILNKNRIPVRNLQEATILRNENQRAYSVDDNYFDIESSNMAYILGFLAADGSISKKGNSIKIGLSSKDKELLRKIQRELKIEKEIFDYTTNKGYDVSELAWTSKRHKQILATYNIVPQKTFSLKPPFKLNEKYHLDYVRGYFDGDGSVNLIANSNGRGQGNVRWQICSATKEILEWILNVLEKNGIPKVNILEQQKKSVLYYFQYSSISSRKIFHLLYKPNDLYLERKFKKFQEIVKLFE